MSIVHIAVAVAGFTNQRFFRERKHMLFTNGKLSGIIIN